MELALIGAAATLSGAFLGVILTVYLARHERQKKVRAIAKTLLFEIDHFYLIYIERIENALRQGNPGLAEFHLSVGGWQAAIYSSNSQRIGELPPAIAVGLVNFYNLAEAHKAALMSSVPQIHSNQALAQSCIDKCTSLASLVYMLCGQLSSYTAIPFEPPIIKVAANQNISDETKSDLKRCVAELETQLPWTQRLAKRRSDRTHNKKEMKRPSKASSAGI